MGSNKRSISNNAAAIKTERPAMIAGRAERIDKTPVIIETTSGELFLKPIIIVEDGIARTTKYRLRRTRKGMLRLE